MPITIPSIDNRRYQDLLDEALARIPVHNPEWTNFNRSDPGVTLLELFAFLTENLLYRANLIPERNRRKFLSLLGVPLETASPARGIVTIANDRGPLETVTFPADIEVKAGQTPFRTTIGLDVLPVEAQVYYKRRIDAPKQSMLDYYSQLYASYKDQAPNTSNLVLYETVPLTTPPDTAVDLATTPDRSLWIALLARPNDKPYDDAMKTARREIAGKVLSLGIVPSLSETQRDLTPGGQPNPSEAPLLRVSMPKVPDDGLLTGDRKPSYADVDASAITDVLSYPGIMQVTLPEETGLILWTNFDPLEAGVGDFPPALEDSRVEQRVITWVRLTTPPGAQVKILWAGINAATIEQSAKVHGEALPAGTGEPDQTVKLAKPPVIPGSVKLTVGGEEWKEIEDLWTAGPEIRTADPRTPPGVVPPTAAPDKVYQLDPESGEIRFGDGVHGRRPAAGASIRADYSYSAGAAGNVRDGSVNNSPMLPGFKVNNPVRTWGGADAETVAEGEKQIARYLQNRDRLVTAADFRAITLRTPGVDIGRVEVLPAYHPALSPNGPGDAPGAVTLMVIPKYDPAQPDAPQPDRVFLDTVCRRLDSRRLITTEIYLRGPEYKGIYVSIGIDVVAGASIAEVRENVKKALAQFLSPLPAPGVDLLDDTDSLADDPQKTPTDKGWPLRKNVVAMELLAVASRAPGVLLVNNNVLLAGETGGSRASIPIDGLELPRVLGISVTVGEPSPLENLRGTTAAAPAGDFVPVPVIPEGCG